MKKYLLLGLLLLPLTACQSNSSTSPALPPSAASTTAYAMTEVAANNTPQKCWTAINGKVYDLTTWISQHPGGKDPIEGLCGSDGTAAFEQKHGGQGRPEQMLASFQIGVLKDSTVQ